MNWHHAPIHRFTEPGRYIITAGTYQKQHFFRSGHSRSEGGLRMIIAPDRVLVSRQHPKTCLQYWNTHLVCE